MKQPTWLLLSLSLLALGQLVSSPSVIAQSNVSDITGDGSSQNSRIQRTNRNNNPNNSNLKVTYDNNNQRATISGISGELGLSPDVINLIPNVASNNNATAFGEDTAVNGENGNSLEGRNTTEITICLIEPCVPGENTDKAITLNDLAKLIEADLNQSLSDLAAAEALEQDIANQPRRIVRRRSSSDPNACVSPVAAARQEVTTKLEQSRQFLEQIEQFQPEKNIW